MISDSSPFALFDDNLADLGDLLLDDLLQVISCTRAEQLESTFDEIEAARQRGQWVALAATYELGYALEPRLRALAPDDGTPLLTAWVFGKAERLQASETGDRIARALTSMTEHERTAGVAALSCGIEREAYRHKVARIRTLISAGDCYQVNFTFPLTGELFGHPLALYDILRRRQPVRFGSFIRHPEGTILSRSPELFVERSADLLRCRPMKGTAARDASPALLTGSEKNRAENLMIVDLIRNDLGRLVPPGGVKVDSLFDLESYPSVWQMTSTISARPVEADLPAILRALFPCGSITGAPKIRAMEIIRELETEARGIYCGALGWLAPDGDFRFSVPIRTLDVDRSGSFRCGLGSGIVADSDPDAEWEECLLKGRFLSGLNPAFGLIETMRYDSGVEPPCPLLELHLARLGDSARHFGFVCDIDAIRQRLSMRMTALAGPHRVRLELSPNGSATITAAPLVPLPEPVQSVIISSQRVRSDDPVIRHKTTARELYDTGLDQATREGYFDVLFFNEHGELAEGARSNVFVDSGDGVLLTPPLESGVLDGVCRRSLLIEGRAREARLSRDALRSARAVFVANALRGLIRVRVAGL